jgi:hypothetical protein
MNQPTEKVAQANKRMAITLGSIAIVFFAAIIIKKLLIG